MPSIPVYFKTFLPRVTVLLFIILLIIIIIIQGSWELLIPFFLIFECTLVPSDTEWIHYFVITSRKLFPKFVMKIRVLLSLLKIYQKPGFVLASPLLPPPACYFCTGNIVLSKRLLKPSVCSPTSSSCELVTCHKLPGAQASIAKKNSRWDRKQQYWLGRWHPSLQDWARTSFSFYLNTFQCRYKNQHYSFRLIFFQSVIFHSSTIT